MANCRATSLLLNNEETVLDQDYNFVSDDDSVTSSGYDSCVVSVQEYSDSEPEFDDAAFYEDDEVLIYENTKPIVNTMEYILSMPSLCDVVFLVGKEKTIIRGLMAVMASRNRILCRMLLKEKKRQTEEKTDKKGKFSGFRKKSSTERRDTLTVEIDSYDSDVFYRLISFIHTGHVSVIPETVVGLMCAAEEFEIPELQKACWDFSFRCLANGNVATIIQSSRFYKGRIAADQLLTKLTDMAQGPKTTAV